MDTPTPYASHETDDGFTVESNTATVEQLEREDAPVETAPEDNGDQPATDPEPEKLTPFRKGAKPRDDAFARMKQATDKLAEANRLREAAETKLRDVEARYAQQQQQTRPPAPAVATSDAPKAGAPKFPTYDAWLVDHPEASWDEWNDEKIDFIAERKLEARDRTQQEQRQQREAAEIDIAHNVRVAGLTTKYPDYDTARQAADLAFVQAGITELPDALVRAVKTSDKSDELMYFLATHPQEAIQLARESADSPVTVAPTLRRYLESLLSAGAAQSTTGSASPSRSSAKPPVNPVGGHASATPVPIDDLEFSAEYVRKQNKRDQEQGRRIW